MYADTQPPKSFIHIRRLLVRRRRLCRHITQSESQSLAVRRPQQLIGDSIVSAAEQQRYTTFPHARPQITPYIHFYCVHIYTFYPIKKEEEEIIVGIKAQSIAKKKKKMLKIEKKKRFSPNKTRVMPVLK